MVKQKNTTQRLQELEARMKYLETGYDKLWEEMSKRTCELAKYIDKILEQQNNIREKTSSTTEEKKMNKKGLSDLMRYFLIGTIAVILVFVMIMCATISNG